MSTEYESVTLSQNGNSSYEPLTDPSKNRLTVFPIEYLDIWDAYKKQLASFWTAEEIDFSKDYEDFQKLNKDEQHFIKMVLAFFAASDTIVNINIGERFIKDVQIREAIICYNYQMMMENIHSEVYSLQIDNIIHDTEEKNKMFRAIEYFPCVAKKADWAKKWTESDAPFAQRLIAFAIVEGVFFSGSFASIFWLKNKGNFLLALQNSNAVISKDEMSHCSFAILLYSHIRNKLSEETIHNMIKEAVLIEIEFICESLKCALLGINPTSMIQYIKYVADRLLVMLNYNKIYNVSNPFDFMELISLENKSNFFENRTTEYQRASVLNKTKEKTFELTEDF